MYNKEEEISVYEKVIKEESSDYLCNSYYAYDSWIFELYY